MDVIYHIKALHRQGLTTREIAAALKINRESVLKYIKQPVIIRSPIKREENCYQSLPAVYPSFVEG